jgi:aldehyde dehydrogenase (NAD+)
VEGWIVTPKNLSEITMNFLKELNIKDKNFGASTGLKWSSTIDQGQIEVISPVDGQRITSDYLASEADYENIVTTSHEAFSPSPFGHGMP